MAQASGRNSSLVVWDNTGASQNLSGDMNNVVMTFPKDNPESTTFGQNTKQKLSSLRDTTLAGTSIWNSGITHVDTVLSGILSASQNTLVQFIPGGTISGCAMRSAYMQLQSYAVTDPLNGAVAANYTFQGTAGYASKVLNLFGTAIVGYWPMFESSGTVSHDLGGRSHIGAYTGVTLGLSGIGDGNTAASFDGSTSLNNIYSTGLNTDFNGAEGTLSVWAKVASAGVWTDAVVRYLVNISVDANNTLFIASLGSGSIYFDRVAGATDKARAVAQSSADWINFVMTWSSSGDAQNMYINGVQQGAAITGLGTWSGSPLGISTVVIGAGTSVPASVWSGLLSHALLLNRAATADEVSNIYKIFNA